VKLSTLIEKSIEKIPENSEGKSAKTKPVPTKLPDTVDIKITPSPESPKVNIEDKDHKPVNYVSQSRGFSIKDQLKKSTSGSDQVEESDQNEVKVESTISSDKEFDIVKLIAVWKKFGDTVKEKSTRMAGIINGMEPELKEDNSIELILSTEAQKEYFDKNYKSDMLKFLQKELSNSQISFTTIVTDQQENSTPYTQEEKFNHLKSKNPDLEILKRDLGLDFE
jgi:DNA polymerase-3 subunit gamma/tau